MADREPLTFRAMEAVETGLRRRLSPRALRLAYRVAYYALKPWWFITRPHTRGVKAVVRRGDRVLLVRHTYARRDQWDLPGGFVHPDEDPAVALRRELGEELGIDPVAMRRISETGSRNDHKREILYAYVAEVDGEAVTPNEAEIGEARWFPHDALPPRTRTVARRMVARSYWPDWDAEEA